MQTTLQFREARFHLYFYTQSSASLFTHGHEFRRGGAHVSHHPTKEADNRWSRPSAEGGVCLYRLVFLLLPGCLISVESVSKTCAVCTSSLIS